MAIGDLTSLAHVKAFMPAGVPISPDDDDLIRRLIRSYSAKFRNETNRNSIYRGTFTHRHIAPTGYTRVRAFDQFPPLVGITPSSPILGATRTLLDEYPVTAVTSVTVDNQTIPQRPVYNPATPNAARDGWELRDDGVDLYGFTFTPGAPVVIVYTAGYEASGESHTIPASPYIIQPDQFWISDLAVAFASGGALTPVTSSPATGQYMVSSTGLYTFAAADVGRDVLLSYGMIPAEVEQAVIGRVALAYNERPNLGVASANVAGAAVNFSPNVAAALSAWSATIDYYTRPVTG